MATKSNVNTHFIILPGENPVDFIMLQMQVEAEFSPVGCVEKDLALTVAKCIWRKRRFQRLLWSNLGYAQLDTGHPAYDEGVALIGFCGAIGRATNPEEISTLLSRLTPRLVEHLKEKCAEDHFETPEAWVKALQKEVEEVLLPAATRFEDTADLLLLKQSSAVLTDEVFSKELEIEARIDREMERAIERLEKLQVKRRDRSFRQG